MKELRLANWCQPTIRDRVVEMAISPLPRTSYVWILDFLV